MAPIKRLEKREPAPPPYIQSFVRLFGWVGLLYLLWFFWGQDWMRWRTFLHERQCVEVQHTVGGPGGHSVAGGVVIVEAIYCYRCEDDGRVYCR
jgi:hypothetical protein